MRRAEVALAAGVVVGAALALMGLRSPEPGIPEGAVALVNGTPILDADYRRALEAVAADLRRPVDDDVRRHVLERLVDEVLLVERALELDLGRRHREARAQLVGAVVALLTARADQETPDDATLRAFYAEHAAELRAPGRIHVRAPGVPDGPLPATKLADYVGPGAVDAVAALAPGESTIVDGARLELVARTPGALRPFDVARPAILDAYRRRAADEALRRFLDARRAAARVVTRDANLSGWSPD